MFEQSLPEPCTHEAGLGSSSQETDPHPERSGKSGLNKPCVSWPGGLAFNSVSEPHLTAPSLEMRKRFAEYSDLSSLRMETLKIAKQGEIGQTILHRVKNSHHGKRVCIRHQAFSVTVIGPLADCGKQTLCLALGQGLMVLCCLLSNHTDGDEGDYFCN